MRVCPGRQVTVPEVTRGSVILFYRSWLLVLKGGLGGVLVAIIVVEGRRFTSPTGSSLSINTVDTEG